METLSIVTESLHASDDDDDARLEHWEESDNKEAPEEEASESSKSMNLAHREESDDKEAHEEDDYAPISFKKQVLDPIWMDSIKEKRLLQPGRIKVSSANISTSIHKVPFNLSEQDKNAYTPQIVSIGPLHYNERGGRLQVIEEHKWRYLNEIVSGKGEVWFEQCMVAIKKLEKKARECYSQVIELDSNSFVEMMVLDGCFIIGLFRKNWSRQFEDDPLFKLKWLHRALVIDLVMLENQIPFFILQTLFDLIEISYSSLRVAALKFFRRWPFYRNILPTVERTGTSKHHIRHLLHLLHENIVLSTEKTYSSSSEASTGKEYKSSKATKAIQCASKLQESGIKFKRRELNNGAGNLLDIKFDKEKGIIEIPTIIVEDGTNSMLRNLIAFELCYRHCKKYIITYTYFMDCLIDSSKDVEILCQKRIIKTSLGSNKEVALLFNSIHKEVIGFRKSFYLCGIRREINHYCGATWPKLRAALMRDYFKNPWAVISFVAAVLLLLFTMTQAFFAIFPKFAVGN